MRFTPDHYRDASLHRIADALELYKQDKYAGAIYYAGVSVECILRAYRVRQDPEFDSRHDLEILEKSSGIATFIPENQGRHFAQQFTVVWSRWKNDYRYASDERLRSEFRRLKLYQGIKGDFLKENARITMAAALELVNQGVSQWNSKMS
ncbi:hypothetical protein BH09SUM1_BH09SUM1_16550 [soil metagenome]